MAYAHVLLLAIVMMVPTQDGHPPCQAEPGRRAEQLRGEVARGDTLSKSTASGWILRLVPIEQGWSLQISMKTRETEDLSRLTPPWHFVPNPREIEGWHFRNADNTGPNDGSVNAPQELREFIFSPQVGQGIEYNGSATTAQDVAKVESFGRGWFFIESYKLTPPRKGGRAAFQSLKFSACITWPANQALHPTPAGTDAPRPRVSAGR